MFSSLNYDTQEDHRVIFEQNRKHYHILLNLLVDYPDEEPQTQENAQPIMIEEDVETENHYQKVTCMERLISFPIRFQRQQETYKNLSQKPILMYKRQWKKFTDMSFIQQKMKYHKQFSRDYIIIWLGLWLFLWSNRQKVMLNS